MERKKLIGKKKVSYTSRKTGNPVNGVSLQCVCERSDTEGLAVCDVFISSRSGIFEDCQRMPLNCEFELAYDNFGNPCYMKLCK